METFDITAENIRLDDLKKWCEERIAVGHTYFELQTSVHLHRDKEGEIYDADVSAAELKSHAV